MRICICATQIPFSHGGAEIHVEGLHRALVQRGFDAELVTVPFSWNPRLQILKSGFAWRLLNLETLAGQPVDLVIATRFPSYLIQHSNKVVWLIHQFRQVYDLLGTPYSDFDDGPQDRAVVRMIREMDNQALSEARALFANSQNTADRLKRFNGLEARALHPPPKLGSAYRQGPFGDYVFTVGRLDRLKRLDLLVRAMGLVRSGVRCKIAGAGPDQDLLRALIDELGLSDRVTLLGRVTDEELVELYANSLAVFYAPHDEDFGYVTIEAFRSGKPVITAADSGGVLEFAHDGRTGLVCPAGEPREFAERIDALCMNRDLAHQLGSAGYEMVGDVTWDRVVQALTGVTA